MNLFDDQLIEMKREGTTDLRKLYPVSQRRVAKRVLPWVVGCTFINWAVFSFVSSLSAYADESVLQVAQNSFICLLALSILGCLIFFIYEELYHSRYRYAIEAGHLVICKGLFLKERGSFPLSRITEVYLERSFLDLVFGVYQLHISTPTSHSGEFAYIVGLTRDAAMGLQETITGALDSPIDIEMAQAGAKQVKGAKKKEFSKRAIETARKNRPIMGS